MLFEIVNSIYQLRNAKLRNTIFKRCPSLSFRATTIDTPTPVDRASVETPQKLTRARDHQLISRSVYG